MIWFSTCLDLFLSLVKMNYLSTLRFLSPVIHLSNFCKFFLRVCVHKEFVFFYFILLFLVWIT